jgi:diadenosine tetraphosphate (Ap4A) HIT family hydrolase
MKGYQIRWMIIIILGVAIANYNSDILIIKDLICVGFQIPMICPPLNINKDKCSCVFCDKKNIESRLLYEDNDFLAFMDRNPSAKLHFLVVPKNHVPSFDQLKPLHLPMVQRMKEIALTIFQNQSISSNQVRMGFHLPPFNSVHHLHLHGIGRPFINIFRALKYPAIETCWWTRVRNHL